MKANMSKDSKELEGRLKVVKERRSRSNRKREILREICGRLQNSQGGKKKKKLPNYYQQNHANKKEVDRVGRTYSEQILKKGVSINWEVPIGKAVSMREQNGFTKSQEKTQPRKQGEN